MLKAIMPSIEKIMSSLEEDQELDVLLIKHDPKLANIDIIVKIIDNSAIFKNIMKGVSKFFTSIEHALQHYNDQNTVLLYISEFSLYVMYDQSPSKLVVPGKISQVLRSDFPQKMIINVIDSDELCYKKIAQSSDITLEKTNEYINEITIEGSMYSNYHEAKQKFEQEFLPKINDDSKNKLCMPKLHRSGIIEYSYINITDSIKSGNLNSFKNQLKLPQIELPVDEKPKVVKKLSPGSIPIVTWITENPPSVDEPKLDYYAKYIKTASPVTQRIFTMAVKSAGYSELKKGKVVCWVKSEEK
jgi:hypothetical protein